MSISKPEVVILESDDYSPIALNIINEIGNVRFYDNSSNFETNIIVVRLSYHLDRVFLSKFPKLKLIVSPTTGLNHIDLSYCDQMGINVISLKGESDFLSQITATAELTFGLILSLVRNISASHRSVITKREWVRDEFKGRELQDMTLGILGFGRLGQKVAEYAEVFGMKVLANDPFVGTNIFKEKKVTACSKEFLFKESDILTVHVNYEFSNHNLVDCDDFNIMKKGSYFVNTARGELINEEALLQALLSGTLSGAALDVLDNEQDLTSLFSSSLLEYAKVHDNLLITPHIGGCTIESMHKTEVFIAKKLKLFLESK